MNAFPEDGDAQAGDGPVEDCEVDDGFECDAGGDSEAPRDGKSNMMIWSTIEYFQGNQDDRLEPHWLSNSQQSNVKESRSSFR